MRDSSYQHLRSRNGTLKHKNREKMIATVYSKRFIVPMYWKDNHVKRLYQSGGVYSRAHLYKRHAQRVIRQYRGRLNHGSYKKPFSVKWELW